jgi:hypothetical protein
MTWAAPTGCHLQNDGLSRLSRLFKSNGIERQEASCVRSRRDENGENRGRDKGFQVEMHRPIPLSW